MLYINKIIMNKNIVLEKSLKYKDVNEEINTKHESNPDIGTIIIFIPVLLILFLVIIFL